LGVLYRHFSNSRLSLEGGRGMPVLREGDRFLVDLVEADEVEMVTEGCRVAEVWRVSELRKLDGAGAVESGGALERLVGEGKAGKTWREVVRRVAQVRGVRVGVVGRTVRAGAESRCSRPLGAWVRSAVSDWSIAAWTVDGVVVLGMPQSGPGMDHLVCRQLSRTEGQLPKLCQSGCTKGRARAD
jgi:hypothetical protein